MAEQKKIRKPMVNAHIYITSQCDKVEMEMDTGVIGVVEGGVCGIVFHLKSVHRQVIYD